MCTIYLGRHAYLDRILVLQTRIHDPCPQQIIRFGFSRFQYPLPRYLSRVKRRRHRDPAAVAANNGSNSKAKAKDAPGDSAPKPGSKQQEPKPANQKTSKRPIVLSHSDEQEDEDTHSKSGPSHNNKKQNKQT